MSFRDSLRDGYQRATEDDADLSTTARVVMFLGLLALIGIIMVIAL